MSSCLGPSLAEAIHEPSQMGGPQPPPGEGALEGAMEEEEVLEEAMEEEALPEEVNPRPLTSSQKRRQRAAKAGTPLY